MRNAQQVGNRDLCAGLGGAQRPLVPELTLPTEVDRWASDLTGDARAQGISGSDLNKTVGDIDDYLTAQHAQVSTAAE